MRGPAFVAALIAAPAAAQDPAQDCPAAPSDREIRVTYDNGVAQRFIPQAGAPGRLVSSTAPSGIAWQAVRHGGLIDYQSFGLVDGIRLPVYHDDYDAGIAEIFPLQASRSVEVDGLRYTFLNSGLAVRWSDLAYTFRNPEPRRLRVDVGVEQVLTIGACSYASLPVEVHHFEEGVEEVARIEALDYLPQLGIAIIRKLERPAFDPPITTFDPVSISDDAG
ncbi:hypothetical protein [Pontivivens ytuae]|uniref:Uncharacterized protein n=1 Tax=Pontivivens ytuae TaxID=2789856 RepID=A0A7S9LR37_9RHOB|nr:hypothetical protein [Pontivivens ytuae]QPH53744.1 hypothetical protein I0K15_18505 [Pontivivens ytuae]